MSLFALLVQASLEGLERCWHGREQWCLGSVLYELHLQPAVTGFKMEEFAVMFGSFMVLLRKSYGFS